MMLLRCKVCLLRDMNGQTGDKHDFISYDKIAGEINVGTLFDNEKNWQT